MVDRVWQSRLPDSIALPGSTDLGRYGAPGRPSPPFRRPERLVEYVGPAWYQRDITIPYAWRRRRITLFLERCHWETRLWVDGREIGSRDSLSVPHVYDITSVATPGRHRLTIRVDNRIKHDIGEWASAISEDTQTNWNGIIGRIELRSTARVWIEDVRTYPDVSANVVKVRSRVGNITGRRVKVALTHTLRDGSGEAVLAVPYVGQADCGLGYTWVEYAVPVPGGAGRWDEFTPRRIELGVGLRATDGETTWLHGRYATFGMRSLSRDRTHFIMNGRRIYLRGVVECCVFPQTGFPPTDRDAWKRLLRVVRDYGFNHVRFHTWCPPEGAFEAADELGLLLQIESPLWANDVGRNPARDRFIRDETLRILDAYGNHPSFGLYCIGNELTGDRRTLRAIVDLARAHDPRRLYTSSTAFSLDDGDDYAVAALRGLRGPRTDHDYRMETRALQRPTIAHEIGQWTVFPDIRDIGRFAGVIRPSNLLDVQKGLAAAGLLSLAPAVVQSTGRAAVELYKEEIEVQLRNPDSAGFQLFSLHDLPGHGTATVGLLNAFRESKGFIAPEDLRRFCSPTVPVVRLERRAYEIGDTVVAPVEVAHYGPADVNGAIVDWALRSHDGETLASGGFGPMAIPTGALTAAGTVRVQLGDRQEARVRPPLSDQAVVKAPVKLTLEVSLRGGNGANSWSLWAYPRRRREDWTSRSLHVANAVNGDVLSALRNGRRVVILSDRAARRSIKGSALPVFRSPVVYPVGPLTMGILCDPNHPALARFPTDAWSDWQWHDILEASRSMVTGETQPLMEPVVRVVDNFTRNLPLALVAQARVGPGRLLVCGADLRKIAAGSPAVGQLLAGLFAYAESEDFDPRMTIGESELLSLFRGDDDRTAARTPPPLSGSVLHVLAGARAKKGVTDLWANDSDRVVASAPGFAYKVRGSAYCDDRVSGWTGTRELRIGVEVPKGFEGIVAVRFNDWNDAGRVAQVYVDGRFVETVTDYGGTGYWLKVPVTRKDTSDGQITVISRPEGADDFISELAAIPSGKSRP